ncbi:MAG TPA: carboxypeptidase-like regulatory domain-containing protein, partial [Pyrinomonadaceae bacterium]|nr:carboxypeptidase-like regulatory domain-containing protein [Pyrinomonadaceae bacterium]
MYRSRNFIAVLCVVVLLAVVSAGASASAQGGAIAGRVVNQKGEPVAGATVTATDASGRKRQATTDGEGRFRIEGLAPGSYGVTANAKGFAEAQAAGVVVAEGQAASLDLRLEVAPIDAGSVTVTATGNRANSDPVYTKLRQQPNAQFDSTVYAVNNLVLKRDAATFTLRSGEVYFLPPVEGRTVGAVFVGDGQLTMTPPTEAEKKSLAIFVNDSTLNEDFTQLVLRFSDKTFDELKNSPNASARTGGTHADRARSAYRNTATLLRKRFRTNADIRALADLYAPERPGYFVAFIDGKRHSNLVFQMDPLGIPTVSP